MSVRTSTGVEFGGRTPAQRRELILSLEQQIADVRDRLDVLEEVVAHDGQVRESFRAEIQKAYKSLLLQQAN